MVTATCQQALYAKPPEIFSMPSICPRELDLPLLAVQFPGGPPTALQLLKQIVSLTLYAYSYAFAVIEGTFSI